MAILLAAAAPAGAATQGEAGTHSSGSILIVASVAAQARLLGGASAPCVTLNTATRGYTVAADPAATLPRCGDAEPRTGARMRTDGTQSLIVAPE